MPTSEASRAREAASSAKRTAVLLRKCRFTRTTDSRTDRKPEAAVVTRGVHPMRAPRNSCTGAVECERCSEFGEPEPDAGERVAGRIAARDRAQPQRHLQASAAAADDRDGQIGAADGEVGGAEAIEQRRAADDAAERGQRQ